MANNKNGFLDNLKDVLDNGKFNSQAAIHLNKIHEAAENVDAREVEEKLKKSYEDVKPVGEEEAEEMNKVYEDKISKLRELDEINKALVSLINLEANVNDALEILKNETNAIDTEFIIDAPQYDDLYAKIKEIKKHFKFK